MKQDVCILAIESSCDETAAAVVKNGREVLSNVISSQIDLHTLYGGVVPEIASRKHIEKINQVVEQALLEAKESLEKVMDSLAMDMPEDFYSIDLMNAYQMLGEIIGEAVDEDLVDTIFKEFCMGK